MRIDPRTPLDIVVTSDIGDVDIDDLVRFSELAWRHNYKGRLRVVYDAPFYAWLLSGKDWFAVLARNGEGRIVGCMFALVRDLYIRGESFPSVYSTGWAVDPAYRRTGVSLRLWLALHDRVREGGYVSIGASHAGLSGTRGDVVFRDDAEDRGRIVSHHCGAIWSRPVGGSVIAHAPVAMQRLCFVDGEHALECADMPIDLATLSSSMAATGQLTFAPSRHFRHLYLNSEFTRSGTMWVETDDGARCAVGFSIFALAMDDLAVGTIGRIQFFLPFDGGEAAQVEALNAMSAFLARQGCSTVSMVEQPAAAPAVMERCGFTKAADSVTFSVRSPVALAHRFDDAPPFALDFL